MFKINQTEINVSGFPKRYQSIERNDIMMYTGTEQFITIPKSNFTWFSRCLKYIILKHMTRSDGLYVLLLLF